MVKSILKHFIGILVVFNMSKIQNESNSQR